MIIQLMAFNLILLNIIVLYYLFKNMNHNQGIDFKSSLLRIMVSPYALLVNPNWIQGIEK
jgi:hypothetical protein